MTHRGFRSFSTFPVLVFLTIGCVTLMMICVRELGVAGYTKFVCGSSAVWVWAFCNVSGI
jgi:hypothetical protein